MAAANDGTLEFASSGSNNNNNTSSINNNSNSSSSSNSLPSNSSSNIAVASNNTSSSSNNSNSSSNNYGPPPPMALDPRYACVAPLLPPPLPPLAPPPRSLEHLIIYENFDVHETHRIEDGVCTHITRLPPKKQELLKQFGIQSSSQQCLSNYEKYIIIENFIKFCNEYQISDHRPFLDFHESALSKCEQLKFVRYLGQGLSNLTLNKIYVGFKDLLGSARLDKCNMEGYNLDAILKKKRKNLYNRLHAAAPSLELAPAYEPHQQQQLHQQLVTTPRHAFAALTATTRSEVCNEMSHPAMTMQYSFTPR